MDLEPEELKALVRSVLGPATRWTIRLEERDSGRQLIAEHPASHGLVLEWSDLEVTTERAARRFLQSEEFALADSAPELVNAEAVMAVRSFADAFGWSTVEVRSVAALLRSIGAITDDEFAWLDESVAVAPNALTGPRPTTP